MILDRIVLGIGDTKVQEILLQEQSLTLDEAAHHHHCARVNLQTGFIQLLPLYIIMIFVFVCTLMRLIFI